MVSWQYLKIKINGKFIHCFLVQCTIVHTIYTDVFTIQQHSAFTACDCEYFCRPPLIARIEFANKVRMITAARPPVDAIHHFFLLRDGFYDLVGGKFNAGLYVVCRILYSDATCIHISHALRMVQPFCGFNCLHIFFFFLVNIFFRKWLLFEHSIDLHQLHQFILLLRDTFIDEMNSISCWIEPISSYYFKNTLYTPIVDHMHFRAPLAVWIGYENCIEHA